VSEGKYHAARSYSYRGKFSKRDKCYTITSQGSMEVSAFSEQGANVSQLHKKQVSECTQETGERWV
jgi:hypothetical protein